MDDGYIYCFATSVCIDLGIFGRMGGHEVRDSGDIVYAWHGMHIHGYNALLCECFAL
ncbi:hypothetical protein LguiA_005808 [Lonicera macranthoides]